MGELIRTEILLQSRETGQQSVKSKQMQFTREMITDVLDPKLVTVDKRAHPMRKAAVVWDPISDEMAVQVSVAAPTKTGEFRIHTFTLVGEEINQSPLAKDTKQPGTHDPKVVYEYKPTV